MTEAMESLKRVRNNLTVGQLCELEAIYKYRGDESHITMLGGAPVNITLRGCPSYYVDHRKVNALVRKGLVEEVYVDQFRYPKLKVFCLTEHGELIRHIEGYWEGHPLRRTRGYGPDAP